MILQDLKCTKLNVANSKCKYVLIMKIWHWWLFPAVCFNTITFCTHAAPYEHTPSMFHGLLSAITVKVRARPIKTYSIPSDPTNFILVPSKLRMHCEYLSSFFSCSLSFYLLWLFLVVHSHVALPAAVAKTEKAVVLYVSHIAQECICFFCILCLCFCDNYVQILSYLKIT